MEILIALGMVWQVSSDKWKAPLDTSMKDISSPRAWYFKQDWSRGEGRFV